MAATDNINEDQFPEISSRAAAAIAAYHCPTCKNDSGSNPNCGTCVATKKRNDRAAVRQDRRDEESMWS